MRKLKKTAKWVIQQLKKEGFIVQRYDSFSTNSIYLKLDYGVMNSIRISDHRGKKYLSYRYNMLTCCPELIASRDKEGFVKYYFPINEHEVLIKKILYDRQVKLGRMGEVKYKIQMRTYKERGQKQKGFWQSARIV